jgi:hypothetical protein
MEIKDLVDEILEFFPDQLLNLQEIESDTEEDKVS